MGASLKKQSKTQENANRAWELYISGMKQWDIANALGCTQARVSQMIKKCAKAHPINQLSLEERMALSEERWNLSEQQMREEIQEQRRTGRTVTEVIRLPNGQEQIKTTHQKGVDPALLRCLSTHHDRRARQLNNQISPDAGLQQVQVNVVKDFLQQGDTAGKLSPAEWNQAAVDV